MAELIMKNFTARTAGELCARLKMSDPAKKLLREESTSGEYVSLLRDGKLWQDAVLFMAHGLPKRPAIAWALSCATEVGGPSPSKAWTSAIAQIELWLANPSEENRRNSKKSADAAGLGTPAGCAALAVFFSGGSMAPPDAPVVPPAEGFVANAVVGAVKLAAVFGKPQDTPEKLRRFVDRAIELTNGPAK